MKINTRNRHFLNSVMIVLVISALASSGCGGDSLLLSLPDGNVVKYLESKPSGSHFTASCSTPNVAALADQTERDKMKIRCVARALDSSNQAVPLSASIEIVAEIKEQGKSPPDGESVMFTTSHGSFEPYDSYTFDAVKEKEFDTSAGNATAALYTFPGEGGQEATVTASYVTINDRTVTDSTTVFITQGIGVMVENGCGIRRAETSATDEFVFTLTPSCEPRDVEPMSGEPNHMEEGIIHNPRDGLLTLVFYIDGEEGFTDSNGNGLYDPGEPFFGQDLAEPYVDENDNSQFDTNEPYIDLDENGEWSEANGRWDEDTLIWKKVHILFSGMPHESVDTTRFEPSGINIDAGGSQTLTLYLMDINHNPLAVNGDGTDIIEFTEGKGGADITSDYNVSLTKTMGVEFTSDGNIIIEKFNENRSYQVTLSDSDPEAAEETSVLTDISWTPAPEHEDYSPTTLLESLTAVSGMAN